MYLEAPRGPGTADAVACRASALQPEKPGATAVPILEREIPYSKGKSLTKKGNPMVAILSQTGYGGDNLIVFTFSPHLQTSQETQLEKAPQSDMELSLPHQIARPPLAHSRDDAACHSSRRNNAHACSKQT